MAEPQAESIPVLIRSVLDDARELIREELALARAEIREEMSAAKAAGAALAAAALAAVIGVVLLCVALGGAVADLFDWPVWAGHGLVAVLLAIAAFVCVRYGRRQMSAVRALPKTTASLKENIAWMQSRSNSR